MSDASFVVLNVYSFVEGAFNYIVHNNTEYYFPGV